MTKTLTEQWREGTLEYGYYYVKHTFGWKPFGITIDFWHGPFDKWGAIPNDYVEEVLAPVPSYDEYNELLRHSELSRNLVYEVLVNQKEYNELLDKAKEYKRLQEQLAIATKALKETKEKLLHVELSGLDGDNRQKMYDLMFEDGVIDKALKEMEGVK